MFTTATHYYIVFKASNGEVLFLHEDDDGYKLRLKADNDDSICCFELGSEAHYEMGRAELTFPKIRLEILPEACTVCVRK